MALIRRGAAIREEEDSRYTIWELHGEVSTQASGTWHPEKSEFVSRSIDFARPHPFWRNFESTDHVTAIVFRLQPAAVSAKPDFEVELAKAIAACPRLRAVSVERGHPQIDTIKRVAQKFRQIEFRELESE
jgi:hypothetical protein